MDHHNSASQPRESWTRRSASCLGESSHRRFRSLSFDESSSQRRIRYDVTGTMDRLRSTMVGSREAEPILCLTKSSSSDMSYPLPRTPTTNSFLRCLSRVAGQIPAIILVGMFHLMIGIPFGVSYFPIGWRAGENDISPENDGISGSFPLPGKEALGIRMFLFSTIVGQLVFTLMSGFHNPIGLQMVENVPFCHELASIVIRQQGYGTDALSTLFVLFGLASLIVGVVFWLLGKLELGRIVYYFPTHVLVGCIGGIGLYIAKTGVEVTIDAVFSINAISENAQLLGVVLIFEACLRVLQHMTRGADGKPQYSLLSPIYFCMITPLFYGALWVFRVDVEDATEADYFFPSLDDCDGASQDCSTASTIFDEHLWDMWRVIDLSVVSWPAIINSVPTLVALTLFSLIHVPINIPAFAISTNTEADMNKELVAHGYSNVLAGIFGGLQNYMAYTQSVLYYKSGGIGKASGMAVMTITALLFFIGPVIASYIPRCMAGTLLVHVGFDLFLEGVYDSYGKFDNLEYAGIWLITLVMTMYGMDAAMIAGVIAAISTFVVQSMTYVDPVRGSMSAFTLRSSQWNRSNQERAILDDLSVGRSRILVIQLQGHLFFGNMAHLLKSINQLLMEKLVAGDEPWIVILDFSLVLGIDSSAAQAMAKLRNSMRKRFKVELSIFVSGSDRGGFPCEFDLSRELSAPGIPTSSSVCIDAPNERTGLLTRASSHDAMATLEYSGSHVCDTLDLALIFSENALIHRQDRSLLDANMGVCDKVLRESSSLFEEKEVALRYLENLCPGKVDKHDVELLFSKFEREVFAEDEFLWKQGSPGNCVKLLIRGTLIALLENEAGTSETVESGNTVGELGLVEGVPRMSSVQCLSEEAILYSLSRKSYEQLTRLCPHSARLIDLICIGYLSNRVQHVSNRIFETRCLPI